LSEGQSKSDTNVLPCFSLQLQRSLPSVPCRSVALKVHDYEPRLSQDRSVREPVGTPGRPGRGTAL